MTSKKRKIAVVAIVAAATAVAVTSAFALSKRAKADVPARVSEEQAASTVLASYDGAYSGRLSAMDVLRYTGADKSSDGTYATPRAEATLSVVKSRVMAEEARKAGKTATDEEVSAIESTGVSHDAATDRVLVGKLREDVVGQDGVTGTTTPPPADADGKGYADYVVSVAGDEWDAAAGAWRNPSSEMAKAVTAAGFTKDSAPRSAALAAWAQAEQGRSGARAATSERWAERQNEALGKVRVTLEGALS